MHVKLTKLALRAVKLTVSALKNTNTEFVFYIENGTNVFEILSGLPLFTGCEIPRLFHDFPAHFQANPRFSLLTRTLFFKYHLDNTHTILEVKCVRFLLKA